MSNAHIREITLRRLLEDNFMIAGKCRKAAEKVSDVSVRYYLQNMASRRYQFAMELKDEITFYSGKEPYISPHAYDRERKGGLGRSRLDIVRKILKLAKNSYNNYNEALCRINEGYCREVLLRHKAHIEESIFELKSIKKLIQFQYHENGELKEERSHTA